MGRQYWTLGKDLWDFCNSQCDKWELLSPLGGFACNNSIHNSKKVTPFWAKYNNHPTMQFQLLNELHNIWLEILVNLMTADVSEVQSHQLDKLLKSNVQ